MSYQEFTEQIKCGVEKIVNEKLDNGLTVLRNVTKNNNVEMKAISILRKGEKATPTIYLESYYDEYNSGKTIDEICREIFELYQKSKESIEFKIEDFSEFEKIKEKVFYKLINYDMNANMLKDMPYFRFLDMAIVFYIMISCDDRGIASALIYNQHMENWKVTPEALRKIACDNTWKNYPPVIQKMEDIISEMIMKDILDDVDASDDSDMIKEDYKYGSYDYEDVESLIKEEVANLKADKEIDMYVLTNSIRNNGAVCITYPWVLKNFAEEKNSDIYIIPSSIHEVILIPGTQWSEEQMNKMIMEVNKNELDPVEILSNHVYIYRREDGEIHM